MRDKGTEIIFLKSKWILILTALLSMNDLINAIGNNETRQRRAPKLVVPYQLKDEKIILVYGNRIMLQIPKYKSCNDIKNELWIREYDRTKTVDCRQFAPNRFMFGNFNNNRHFRLRLYRPGNKVSSSRFLFKSPRQHRVAPRIRVHKVASTGPGWIDLRFINKHEVYPQTFTFEVVYRRQVFNTMNDVVSSPIHKLSFNEHIDFSKYNLRTALPMFPCPEYLTKGLYCVVITDFIRPRPYGGRRYSDYVIQIYNYRIVPYFYFEKSPLNYQTEVDSTSKDSSHTKSQMYKCVIRVWDICDPTGYLGPECHKLMRPVMDTLTDPYDEEGDNNYGSYYSEEAESTEADSEPGTVRKGLRRRPIPSVILALRKSWPFWALLFVLLLFCLLPAVYIAAKRRAMYEVMANWYCWSSPDGKIHYIMSVPGGIPERKKAKARKRAT